MRPYQNARQSKPSVAKALPIGDAGQPPVRVPRGAGLFPSGRPCQTRRISTIVVWRRPLRRPTMNAPTTMTSSTPTATFDRRRACGLGALGRAALELAELRLDVRARDLRSRRCCAHFRPPFGVLMKLRNRRRDRQAHHDHDRVGRPRPAAGERRPGLDLKHAQPCEHQEHEPGCDEHRAPDAEAEIATESLERPERLLPRVRLQELDDVADDLAEALLLRALRGSVRLQPPTLLGRHLPIITRGGTTELPPARPASRARSAARASGDGASSSTCWSAGPIGAIAAAW